MIGDKRFLRTIRPRNILSFGPNTPELELLSLNVLVGPNGSGKSNLIETIGLVQAASGNLMEPIRRGGGITEWLWKGADFQPIAELDVTVDYPPRNVPIRHRLKIRTVGQRPELADEAVENERPHAGQDDTVFYFRYQDGGPVLNLGARNTSLVHPVGLALDRSIISQRTDPDQYPEITYLGKEYANIKLFREWNLGRHTQPRKPQPTDLPSDFLSEDAANIALVLNDLEHRSGLRVRLVENLRNADGTIVDFSTRVLGGTIQLFLHYSGLNSPVPATRLSNGTIRYLCLLAILLHPEPPPLVCIEEPELGLHPDLIPALADLLVDASHRMQLVVTTHSDVLVDGLTKVPESIVICEKHDGATQMTRRSAAELSEWLKEYGLGQLWRSGEIGGNRW